MNDGPSRSQQWRQRALGDRKWLQNHRKALEYMRNKTEQQVRDAESAVSEASRRFDEQCDAESAALLANAARHLFERSSNLQWQRTKMDYLNDRGIVLFDEDNKEPHALSEQ